MNMKGELGLVDNDGYNFAFKIIMELNTKIQWDEFIRLNEMAMSLNI